MSWPVAAAIAGSAVLGALGSKSKSSGSQSNQVTPYPRDVSATMLWDTYMNRLLGDKAYPITSFSYGGQPYQVSQASILDSLLRPKQADALAQLYNKVYPDSPLGQLLNAAPKFTNTNSYAYSRREDGGK